MHFHISSMVLKNRLSNESRIDNDSELKRLDFLEIDDIPIGLIRSSRKNQPSSGIRMMYTYSNCK
jgi:hypothetical protein